MSIPLAASQSVGGWFRLPNSSLDYCHQFVWELRELAPLEEGHFLGARIRANCHLNLISHNLLILTPLGVVYFCGMVCLSIWCFDIVRSWLSISKNPE